MENFSWEMDGDQVTIVEMHFRQDTPGNATVVDYVMKLEARLEKAGDGFELVFSESGERFMKIHAQHGTKE